MKNGAMAILFVMLCGIKVESKTSTSDLTQKLEKLADKQQRPEILKIIQDPKNKLEISSKNELLQIYYEPFYSESAQRLFLEATALPIGHVDSMSKLQEALKLEPNQPLALRELFMGFVSKNNCDDAQKIASAVYNSVILQEAKRFFRLALEDCHKSVINLEEFNRLKIESDFYAPLIWQRVILRSLDQGHVLFARDKVPKLKTDYSNFPEIYYLDLIILAQLKKPNTIALQKYRSMCTSANTRIKTQFRWAHQFCSKEKLESEPVN